MKFLSPRLFVLLPACKKRYLFLALFFFPFALFSQDKPADIILGKWITMEGTAMFNIFKISDQYYGSMIWLKEPNGPDGKPKVDRHNPDKKLQNRKLLGLTILQNFKYKGDNVWADGQIYNPRNGKFYSCILTLHEDDQLDVRGYLGIPLLGGTDTWIRIK